MKNAIKAAIIRAQKEYPDLKQLDNPYERIAEFLKIDTVFQEIDGETSIEFAERVENEIDTVWSNM